MNESPEGGPKVDAGGAINELNVILGEIMQTGAVDVEKDMLAQIRTSLEKGEITPEEAIQKARKIQSSRMDYH